MSAEDWTEERVALLKTMRAQGHSYGDIARFLNNIARQQVFTRNAVLGKATRLGLRCFVAQRPVGAIRPKPQPRPKLVRQPKIKPEPIAKPIAPVKGERSIPFIEARKDQCHFFCEGEEGASGFVCGEPVARGRYCKNCARIMWPEWKEKAA